MNLTELREAVDELRNDAERALNDVENIARDLGSMRDQLEGVLDTLDEEPSAPTFEGPVENCGGFIDAVVAAVDAAKRYRIVNAEHATLTDSPVYWSNKWGWGSKDGADIFSQEERDALTLPVGGEWQAVTS